MHRRSSSALLALTATAALIGVAVPAGASGNSFRVTTRVTDATDPSLVNAWGMSQGPNTPVWVSDNGTGKSTLYTATSSPKVALTVTIPGGAPTGTVFNGSSKFLVNGSPGKFLFASESGVLSGWNSGTTAVKERTVKGAVFKGLAIAALPNGSPRLYATDFHNGRVDVFNGQWQRVSTSGAFVDSKIPAGYAPFGIQTLRGRIYVSYAKQDSMRHDDAPGAGHGFVDIYSTSGALLRRLVMRGALNSPWGMAIAPSGFGPFGGNLLVGNFGDGRIHAYDAKTGAAKGTLRNRAGHVIVLGGLWGLLFGNGTSAPKTSLMFTSGPGGEQHGKWGTIAAA